MLPHTDSGTNISDWREQTELEKLFWNKEWIIIIMITGVFIFQMLNSELIKVFKYMWKKGNIKHLLKSILG